MLHLRLVTPSVVAAVVTTGLAVATAAAAEPTNATWVVDRDRTQCANADFTSIQAAVDAAQPSDMVVVCPDRYGESVVIDKPLTLKGDPDAVEAVDCFSSTPSQLGDADPTQQAIVDPPEANGFSIALKLGADSVVVEGLVVEGASVGIDASDRFSGYRAHHNLVRLNTLFGIDFGSDGSRQSRVDHNCFRDGLATHSWGLVSELDDDSVWKESDGPERDEWNARNLVNASIDHNLTFRNRAGLEAAGPGVRSGVSFSNNLSRGDEVGIAIQNSTGSAVLSNEIADTRFGSIAIGGGNSGLIISANRLHGSAAPGIRVQATIFLDVFPVPNRKLSVTQNEATGALNGIASSTNNLADSLIADNTTSGNRAVGINLLGNNSGNEVRGNQADNNGIVGINVQAGATGNTFEHNSMHGNGTLALTTGADARDLNPLVDGKLPNDWINNDCDTDIPAGMICGAE